MRIADRTYRVLDIPLSPREFWMGAALCGALLLGILFAARPALGLLLRVMGIGQ